MWMTWLGSRIDDSQTHLANICYSKLAYEAIMQPQAATMEANEASEVN